MPAPRKMIPKEDINALIERRYNNREISEILNISKSTLKKLLVEYNLKIKPKLDEKIGQRFIMGVNNQNISEIIKLIKKAY